jgi:hypothetical protein
VGTGNVVDPAGDLVEQIQGGDLLPDQQASAG